MFPADYRRLAAVLSFALSAPAMAGLLTGAPEGGYPEIATPPPPAFSIDKTIDVALRPGGNVRLGIDPATVTVESDGVVRYVSVARSTSGDAITAIYEGVRCTTAEVKIYARHFADGGWRPVADPQWQSLYDPGPQRTSLPIAKSGICQDASAGGSARQIVQNLRNDTLRYRP
ncbi:hypothetical protein GN316_20125 [Xylophilus sp. Kf1]|nr:hypothetical protein [Xylophilus sp. Kf1]